jgi:CRISPR-associated protein Cas1
MIRASGLHPGFGALHESFDGKSACVYDLIEEFRAPVVDAIILALFNRRMDEDQLFVRSTTSEGERLCRITSQGKNADQGL